MKVLTANGEHRIMKIAVYGTLKSGYWNHWYISRSRLVGTGWTKDKYGLYVQGIPYVVKEEEVSQVSVEVYEVDEATLRNVDRLEGHPHGYRREPVDIELDNGEDILAELYFFPNAPSRAEVESSGVYRG